MIDKCSICKNWMLDPARHTCPPAFDVRFADTHNHGDEWTQVFAGDAELAAETFAERYDIENEYGILQQGDRCEEIIEVRRHELSWRFNIMAESRPNYSAEEV